MTFIHPVSKHSSDAQDGLPGALLYALSRGPGPRARLGSRKIEGQLPVPLPGSGQGRGTARNSPSHRDSKVHEHLRNSHDLQNHAQARDNPQTTG